MKMKQIILLLLLTSAVTFGSPGILIIDAIEPAASNAPISSVAYDVTLPGGIDVGNGQSFITSTAFDLARITLVKGTLQGYEAGNMLRLHFFAWNPTNDANDVAQWGNGDGTGDDDPLNGTGMTVLFSQDFELPGDSFAEGDYIHFNLGTNIALAANTAYGFTSEFIFGGSGANNLNYKLERGLAGDVFAGGTFISTTTTANNNTANRNMAFYLSDVAAEVIVPPPPLGSVSIGQLEPKHGSALVSNPQQNTSVRVDAAGESFGESFVTTSAFDLRVITLIKHNWVNYKAGNKLRLKVFAWNPTADANNTSEWVKGDGAGDEDPLNGTGMTILYANDLVMPAMIIDTGTYIYLDLGTNITLAANTAYGFTCEYLMGGGPDHFICKAFTDDAVFPDGKAIGTTPTANSVSSDDLTFYLGDTAVATAVETDILSYEFQTENVIKLTVSTDYPSSSYPLNRSALVGKDGWWKALAHSTNGIAPFIETNLTYSATDTTGSNYVVYVQNTNDTAFIKVGAEAIGNFEQRIHDNGTIPTMPYRILKPDVYDPNVMYPLVIGFHGAGGGGTDNTSRSIEAMEHLSTAQVRKDYPAFVITPQATSNWADTPWSEGSYSIDEVPITVWMTMVYEVIDALELEYNIDPNRIYVTGQSMGGFGAYDCVMRDPERFAALVPMAGGGDPTQAINMMNVGIWSFHGALDTVVPVSADREMDAAMIAAGHTNWTYTEYPDAGHAVTIPAWGNTNLIPWIFQQMK